MVTFTYDYEVTTSIPPARLFKSFILDDNFIPKVVPHAIKSVEILEGDGGVGTLKLVTFGEGSQFKRVKHRVDGIDEDNFIFKFTATGAQGDAVIDAIVSVSHVVKMEATADGGSIIKTTSTYHTKAGANITEEEVKGGKERAVIMFKAAETYLLANPDAYN